MELIFLGTSAGRPTCERNVSAIVLDLNNERGSFWLFDCGEGTQQQFLKANLSLAKLEFIFITHLHGDHIFGLPGLLTSRCLRNNASGITLFGPKGIRAFIDMGIKISHSTLCCPFHIYEIDQNGVLFQDKQVMIETRKLMHRIDSYGYRINEAAVTATLTVKKLKNDNPCMLNSNSIEVLLQGRSVVILGDTLPSKETIELAKGADVLVHEATHGIERMQKANQHSHSSTVQAAEIAQKAGVKQLIITHISPYYPLSQNDKLVNECRTVFPNSHIASDLSIFNLSHPAGTITHNNVG